MTSFQYVGIHYQQIANSVEYAEKAFKRTCKMCKFNESVTNRFGQGPCGRCPVLEKHEEICALLKQK